MTAARAAGLVLALALAGCGGSTEPRAAGVEAKLRRHLADRSLSVKWVRCVPGPGGAYRCNVDLGDLHIQIYCAALVGERLRAAEWRPAQHGRQNRAASQRDCVRRLRLPA